MKPIEELADKLAATVAAHLCYHTEGSAKEMSDALKEYEAMRPRSNWPGTKYCMGFAVNVAQMPPGVLGYMISKSPTEPDFDPKKHLVVLHESKPAVYLTGLRG